jgi:uncharacterized membrane-anchored protein YitT (DUF2179 family)
MNKWIQKIKSLSKQEILNTLKNFTLVLLGTFILAIAIEFFILPANLNTGGISGIAMCFQYAGLTNEFITAEVIITIFTWALFFLGLIFLGWKFSVQTLISTIFYPIFIFLLEWLVKEYDWLLIINSASLVGSEAVAQLLCSIFGGACVGAGIAVTFLGGGSTGGVDILTFIVCKYCKKIKSSVSIFAIDATIIIVGVITNPTHDIALALLGVMSAFLAAIMVEKLFVGGSKTFVAYIVTNKPDEITSDVISILDRTTSIIDVEGGYSKQMKKMVMVSFTIQQYAEILAIVNRYDRDAFITINQAHEINGEGFTLEKK